MKVGLIGIDYTCASLDYLEKLHFTEERTLQFVEQLKQQNRVEEIVILSTCNRIEWYVSSENLSETLQDIRNDLQLFWQVSNLDWTPFYELEGADAISHLFHVASGSKSMVIGETEILGQVKQAYSMFQKLGLTQSTLNKLFQTAIFVGKRSREETQISAGAQSVSSIAVDAVHDHFSGIPGRSVLIVGAGTMSNRALKKITSLGHYEVHITNRTAQKAEKFAQDHGVAVYPYEKLIEGINQFDALYFATQSYSFLVNKEDVKDCIKPVLLIDIGMPRNIDPDVVENPFVQLVTIETLKSVVEKNLDNRRDEVDKVTDIIQEEVQKYESWYTHRESQKTLEQCLIQSV